MSDDSVEQPVVLTKCWLCARQHPFEALKPLETTSISETVQRLLVDRYFRNAVPLICAACDVFITTAVKHAPLAFTTKVGQKLLSSAEAFANRDYHGQPVDTAGHWHQGVAMQRTCRWEPWFGTTAETTTTAVTQHAGQPEKQLQCVLENYRVALPGDRHTPPRVAQPRSKRTPRTVARSQVLRHLFAKHNVTNFKKPFYLLMTMKLLPLEWGRHAEHVLRQSWSTAWGGGKILNALLFEGERIVPEDVADMRKNMQRELLQRLQSKRAVCCHFAAQQLRRRSATDRQRERLLRASEANCEAAALLLQIVRAAESEHFSARSLLQHFQNP